MMSRRFYTLKTRNIPRKNTAISNIHFTFLGTSSAVPTLRRNVTSAVMRVDGECMVFDCGEATQHQLMRAQTIRQGKIKRIFITHLHGDHIFGLPGLVTGLCGVKKDMYNNELSQEQEDFRRSGADKLRIYGPRGLKEFLATALRLSEMKIPREYFVHELVESEEEANDLMNNSNAKLYLHSPNEPLYNTIIAPKTDSEGNKTWELFDGPAYKMQAGAIRHTIPCWGYVFAEKEQRGTLDLIKVMNSHLGSKRIGSWLSALKAGETVEGVTSEMVCGPSIPGRKVVILGDTCDPSGLAHLATKCNLLIHEVTMRDVNRAKCYKRGHSTASMAGQFAASIQAKDVVVTHFGGEISSKSANVGNAVFAEIAQSVKRVFGRAPIFARDFLTLQIERKKNVAVSAATAAAKQPAPQAFAEGPTWSENGELEEVNLDPAIVDQATDDVDQSEEDEKDEKDVK